MAILIDESTRVVVQGLTGRSGTFYTDAAIRYGSNYVGGVRPGKGGRRHLGLPVFNTVREAKNATNANASLIVVPSQFAAYAMIEAIEADISVVVCITERVPVHDMIKVMDALKGSSTKLIGPNSQGILVPGICKIGVMSTADARQGRIAIISRSASLTSEVVAQVTQAGHGQSVTIGIGGDPIHGIGFRRCLELLIDDYDTDCAILIGEIGGREEEDAATIISSPEFSIPVISLIVGRHAPEERRMGHAGALSILDSGSVKGKIELLENSGSLIAMTPDEIPARISDVLAS